MLTETITELTPVEALPCTYKISLTRGISEGHVGITPARRISFPTCRRATATDACAIVHQHAYPILRTTMFTRTIAQITIIRPFLCTYKISLTRGISGSHI